MYFHQIAMVREALRNTELGKLKGDLTNLLSPPTVDPGKALGSHNRLKMQRSSCLTSPPLSSPTDTNNNEEMTKTPLCLHYNITQNTVFS